MIYNGRLPQHKKVRYLSNRRIDLNQIFKLSYMSTEDNIQGRRHPNIDCGIAQQPTYPELGSAFRVLSSLTKRKLR